MQSQTAIKENVREIGKRRRQKQTNGRGQGEVEVEVEEGGGREGITH